LGKGKMLDVGVALLLPFLGSKQQQQQQQDIIYY
jgi:hypothetical protein